MQIKSPENGQAKIVLGDLNRVQFLNITTASAALLAAGQEFQFAGESSQFYVIASVVSLTPTVLVDLTADYAGAVAVDTFADYLIWTDFSPNFGLGLPAPGDVDLRGMEKRNFSIIDANMGTGAPGGGAFVKQAITNVTAGVFTATITPPVGAFPTPPYGVMATANWPTWIGWSGQTTGQFVLTFAVEAPASAQVFWGVTQL